MIKPKRQRATTASCSGEVDCDVQIVQVHDLSYIKKWKMSDNSKRNII